MTRPDADRVGDIQRASAVAAEVARLGEGAFDGSLLLQFAAERAIGIIGEAAARLAESPDFVAAHPTARLGEAAGMRNFLAHEYHKTAPRYVWTAITESIPQLLSDIGLGATGIHYT